MPNYRYGKIYQLSCHTTDKIYIGSTCQPLDTRLAEHERSYKNAKYTRKYYTAFEIIKHNDLYNHESGRKLFVCYKTRTTWTREISYSE